MFFRSQFRSANASSLDSSVPSADSDDLDVVDVALVVRREAGEAVPEQFSNYSERGESRSAFAVLESRSPECWRKQGRVKDLVRAMQPNH